MYLERGYDEVSIGIDDGRFAFGWKIDGGSSGKAGVDGGFVFQRDTDMEFFVPFDYEFSRLPSVFFIGVPLWVIYLLFSLISLIVLRRYPKSRDPVLGDGS